MELKIIGNWFIRFIFKNAVGYFPVNLYVEDIKAFDPNEAYGKALAFLLMLLFFVEYDLTSHSPLRLELYSVFW